MQDINVGLIGYKFMGKAHSLGYLNLPLIFGSDYRVGMKVLCGRDEEAVRAAAQNYGWEGWETDWRKVVEREDINLVDVSTPGDTHAEISIAAARAGKNIICEKPLANNLSEAKEMLAAAQEAGVKHMVAFNFRRIPAVALAREFIQEGKLGQIYHWRATWLSDWLMSRDFPLVWRLEKEKAGSGSLGDIGSHVVDLARFLVGEIEEVIGTWETFCKERPLVEDPTKKGRVTVDDATLFLARFANGAIGSFEVTRFAGGNKERVGFEINGEKGSLRFNYNYFNELHYFSWDDPPREQGFKVIYVGDPQHPYVRNWWPNGHFEHYGSLFVNQAYELVRSLQAGEMPTPNFEDGVECQAVLEAVEKSIRERSWVRPADLLS
ncbi:MAG: Gfo/Idh/MocA family protein [Anaerolineae bacterium]